METVYWDGLDKFQRLLAQGGAEALRGLGMGLTNEANAAFKQSQREVPVKTGVLRSSGQVLPPSVVGDMVVVDVVYGGAAKDYAWIQHENESFNHPRGGKAKYLFDPAADRLKGFERRMAVVIEAAIRGLI